MKKYFEKILSAYDFLGEEIITAVNSSDLEPHLRDNDLRVFLPQAMLLHVVTPPRPIQQEPVFVRQLTQHVPYLALHRWITVSHAQGGGHRQHHSNVRRFPLV